MFGSFGGDPPPGGPVASIEAGLFIPNSRETGDFTVLVILSKFARINTVWKKLILFASKDLKRRRIQNKFEQAKYQSHLHLQVYRVKFKCKWDWSQSQTHCSGVLPQKRNTYCILFSFLVKAQPNQASHNNEWDCPADWAGRAAKVYPAQMTHSPTTDL